MLRQHVFEALNNAIENGYDLRQWSAEQIIDDLNRYAADLEAYMPEELRPHIEAWLQEVQS